VPPKGAHCTFTGGDNLPLMGAEQPGTPEPATLEASVGPDGALVLRLAGAWRLERALPDASEVEREIEVRHPPRLSVDAARVTGWDTGLVVFVSRVLEACRSRGVEVDRVGLPPGIQRLLDLVQQPALPPSRSGGRRGLLERVGRSALAARDRVRDLSTFVGETTLGLGRLVVGRARFRRVDLGLLLQQCGADALPIVALVNFLVGIILAFVGITQLRRFGAEYYVADIVGIAVVRDMAALITGVVLAGRSGAAFAAQIATMKVTQEVDALRTLGISPVEFLVVPRVVALTVMMPFLTVFADVMGVLGGASVGTTMMHQPFAAYMRQTASSVTNGDIVGGIVKGATYGALVALAGTMQGMQAERSSEKVGEAATQAVVKGIVAIIAACGVYQYVFFLFRL
jgi:phospholipid/cholesterol/gamma-HCH transport system permease protein